MNAKKILITGASGFIGGRLVEKLILDHGVKVRALVRNFSRASLIARFNIEMMKGEITDENAVDRAVNGCDTVIHCAHDFKNSQNNLTAARILSEVCLKYAIKRVVHVSSISVYEPLPDGDMDENAPSVPCGWEYSDTKLAVEREFLGYFQKRKLPVVVLQPTIVYGPYSQAWTMGPVRQIRNGLVVLPDEGKGMCNALYVDDVVNALILAAECPDAALGERFLISGPAPVTWGEFFHAYEEIIGVNRLVLMPSGKIHNLANKKSLTSKIRLLFKDPQWILSWKCLSFLYPLANTKYGKGILDLFKRATPPRLQMPAEQTLSLYRSRARVLTRKAEDILHYKPLYDFSTGMKITAEYVKWADL